MTEHNIQNRIRCALSSKDRMVFRTNSGTFYQGKQVYSKEFKQPVLINLRKIDGLPKGFPDLLVVDREGVAFVETKTATGRTSKEQNNFIGRASELNLRAGVARSIEEALDIVNRGDRGDSN